MPNPRSSDPSILVLIIAEGEDAASLLDEDQFFLSGMLVDRNAITAVGAGNGRSRIRSATVGRRGT